MSRMQMPMDVLARAIGDLEAGATRRERAALAHPDVAKAWAEHRKAWKRLAREAPAVDAWIQGAREQGAGSKGKRTADAEQRDPCAEAGASQDTGEGKGRKTQCGA